MTVVVMDIKREDLSRRRRTRRTVLIIASVAAAAAITLGLSGLEPAPPRVERGTIWTDTVRRGTFVRQVRGVGTLVPEEIVWIPAASESRVERILAQPGMPVDPSTVLVVLSDPELEQQELAALYEVRAAEAELRNLRVSLESQKLEKEASLASIEAESEQARLRNDADVALAGKNLGTRLETSISTSRSREMTRRVGLERRRAAIMHESARAQLAVQRARIDQLRAAHELLRRKVEALNVRAGISGVLQELPIQVGQRVSLGMTLAKVVQPTRLVAQLKVPETQAKDIVIGQRVSVDTRNGVVEGRVARIDPSVQAGTVSVDVRLTGALPKGARPDLSVDGTIELERLENVVYVGRPSNGRESATVGLFRVEPTGRIARRVPVGLGRGSVASIEVLRGLGVGDVIILSDMAQWDGVDRIELVD
jgi:HlyD family secretion protein